MGGGGGGGGGISRLPQGRGGHKTVASASELKAAGGQKNPGKKHNARDHAYATTPLRCDVVIIKPSRAAAAAAAAQMDRMKEAGAATQSLITMQRSRRANRRRSGSHGGPSPSPFIPAAAAEEAEFHFSHDNSLGPVLCISSFSSHSSSSFCPFSGQISSPASHPGHQHPLWDPTCLSHWAHFNERHTEKKRAAMLKNEL